MNPKIIFVTGKGGVGKTTYAHAVGLKLSHENKDYILIQLEDLVHKIDIPKKLNHKVLNLKECMNEYMLRKLKSKIITTIIERTPFFYSLIDVIPGFHFVIYLGKIMEISQTNPNKTIIIDAPATGHFISLMESLVNFSEIISSGLLFNDLQKILSFLHKPGNAQVHVLSLLEPIVISESLELQEQIKNRIGIDYKVIANQVYHNSKDLLALKSTPNFIAERIKNEIVCEESLPDNLTKIPYIIRQTAHEIVEEITPFV